MHNDALIFMSTWEWALSCPSRGLGHACCINTGVAKLLSAVELAAALSAVEKVAGNVRSLRLPSPDDAVWDFARGPGGICLWDVHAHQRACCTCLQLPCDCRG